MTLKKVEAKSPEVKKNNKMLQSTVQRRHNAPAAEPAVRSRPSQETSVKHSPLQQQGAASRAHQFRQMQRGLGNDRISKLQASKQLSIQQKPQPLNNTIQHNAPAQSLQRSVKITKSPRKTIQRGFLGKVWGGIKSAASAVGDAVKWAGGEVCFWS